MSYSVAVGMLQVVPVAGLHEHDGHWWMPQSRIRPALVNVGIE
jgi:hypothetical protein